MIHVTTLRHTREYQGYPAPDRYEIPLYSSSEMSRQWEFTIDDNVYCVMDTFGMWMLLKLYGAQYKDDWRVIGEDHDVEEFLQKHNLLLGE